MNISQLEYYVSAVERGSYASASKELFVNPSTLSLAVSNLEKEYGIKLLVRSNNDISPTANGQAFYERACAVLSSLSRLSDVAPRCPERKKSGLSLEIAEDPWRGSILGTHLVDTFCAENPDVPVAMARHSNTVCMKAVERGVADAAVTIGCADLEGAESVRLFSRRVGILASRDNPFSSHRSVGIDDILSKPIALPSDVDFFFDKIIDLFRKRASAPNFEYVSTSQKSIFDWIARTNGIVFVIDDHTHSITFPDYQVLPLSEEDDFPLPVFYTYLASSEKIASISSLKRFLLG